MRGIRFYDRVDSHRDHIEFVPVADGDVYIRAYHTGTVVPLYLSPAQIDRLIEWLDAYRATNPKRDRGEWEDIPA